MKPMHARLPQPTLSKKSTVLSVWIDQRLQIMGKMNELTQLMTQHKPILNDYVNEGDFNLAQHAWADRIDTINAIYSDIEMSTMVMLLTEPRLQEKSNA